MAVAVGSEQNNPCNIPHHLFFMEVKINIVLQKKSKEFFKLIFLWNSLPVTACHEQCFHLLCSAVYKLNLLEEIFVKEVLWLLLYTSLQFKQSVKTRYKLHTICIICVHCPPSPPHNFLIHKISVLHLYCTNIWKMTKIGLPPPPHKFPSPSQSPSTQV